MAGKYTADQFLSTLRRGVMPCTVGFVQRRTGLGEHRARALRNELVERGHLVPVSRYKGRKHGFWVTLYRVVRPEASVTSSVRAFASVKRRKQPQAWWQHPLFGTPDGKPPPGTSNRQRKWWRSARWRAGERERAWLAGEAI